MVNRTLIPQGIQGNPGNGTGQISLTLWKQPAWNDQNSPLSESKQIKQQIYQHSH
jgi:hypothetical protein